jgi:site-specific DNA-methyltransferase (adenine-specific)
MLDFGFYNMDCMDGMKRFPDKYFELAIVDPPYGISITDSGRLGKYNANTKRWDDCVPNEKYFNELFRVSKNQIIWGGNYFNLPPTRCFCIWDKQQPENVSFASCEFAWTSFNASAKTFYFSPLRDNGGRIHPTQKPVKLYEWLLTRYATKGDKILDTHVGSASSLIACHNLGFDYVGFEIDKDYYSMANERLNAAKAQASIFDFIER